MHRIVNAPVLLPERPAKPAELRTAARRSTRIPECYEAAFRILIVRDRRRPTAVPSVWTVAWPIAGTLLDNRKRTDSATTNMYSIQSGFRPNQFESVRFIRTANSSTER